jgi:hypothetical protein
LTLPFVNKLISKNMGGHEADISISAFKVHITSFEPWPCQATAATRTTPEGQTNMEKAPVGCLHYCAVESPATSPLNTNIISVQAHPNLKHILQDYSNQRMSQDEMLRRLLKNHNIDMKSAFFCP